MAEIINLNRARKQRRRDEKQRQAADNRVRFGRTRTEKDRAAAEEAAARANLDGHRLDSGEPKPD